MAKFLFKVPLKEVLMPQKGSKPSILEKNAFENSVPYLDINALETGVISEYTYKELANVGSNKDILVVWDGSRSGLVFMGQFGAVASTIMRLTPIGFDPEYVYYFLKSKYRFINGNPSGDSIPHVKSYDFFSLEIPYLVLVEQKKAVLELKEKLEQKSALISGQKNAIIETLNFTKIDFEKDASLITAFENFKYAVLQKAFSGELSRTEGGESRVSYAESVIPEDYENFLGEFVIPSDWHWKNLKHIGKLAAGGTPKRGVKSYWNGDIPWVSSGEVNNSFISATKEQITVDGVKASSLKVFPENTLLMAMVGEGKTRGRVALLKMSACVNQNICAVILENGVDPKYVFYYLQLRYKEIRAGSNKSRSSSSQTALNSNIIGNINICLPSYLEQVEIVSKLDEIFSVSDRILDEYYTSVEDLKKLEISIIEESFQGDFPPENIQGEYREAFIKSILEEKSSLDLKRANLRAVQANFKKTHFMKNTSKNIVSEIKRYAQNKYLKLTISSAMKIEMFENIKSIIPDMDYDDFSQSFQELAQEKLDKRDPEPFFISKNIDGRLHHIINSNEVTVL